MSDAKNTKDKMIPDPENPENMIENPDYVEPEEEEEDDEEEEEDEGLSPELQAKLDKILESKLEKLKKSLDKVDADKRDALKRVAEYEKKEREAETARLKEEGKLAEAHQRELEDRDAKISLYEEKMTKLTRDMDVRDALSGLTFRNDRARRNAVRDITEELVQDDHGEWKHKSGTSIAAFVEAFFKDDQNTFYLKPKTNRGGGTDHAKPSDKDQNTSLFSKSQEQVLKEIEDRIQREGRNRYT